MLKIYVKRFLEQYLFKHLILKRVAKLFVTLKIWKTHFIIEKYSDLYVCLKLQKYDNVKLSP